MADIQSAEFIKGIRGTDSILYDGKPQIAFVGSSNVGKSSVINSLAGRKHLARSSSKPGKTIHLDFFLINGKYYFVDLPGYGFAKRSYEEREDIRKMMMWYLEYSNVTPKYVVIIIDAKIGLREFDVQMIELLTSHHIPFILVLNKIDTLKMGQKEKALKALHDQLGDARLVEYSAKTDFGRLGLLKLLFT